MIKLAIADDHTVFREGIASLFEHEKEIQVVAQAENGIEFLKMLADQPIDVVLMDISMPELDGIEASVKIKKEYPSTKIIMLTMHENHKYIREILEIGVEGYLLKTTSKEEILEAVQTVVQGKKFYGADVQQVFMNSFNSDNVVSDVQLTQREKEILHWICEEHSTQEIADKLFLSPHTVETHRKNLLSKTGCKNVAGLVKFAFQNKLL